MEHEELKKIWRDFVTNGMSSEKIRAQILESWKRCQQLGVSPYQKASSRILPPEVFARRKRRNQELIETAMPIMQNIYRFVAGSEFVVVLGDKDGVLLEILGDRDVLESIKKGNFMPGVEWGEEAGGTNGIGTVLYLGEPLQVYSYEHYCICSHKWTCSGAPIRDSEGKLIGVIDLIGPYDKANPHTLGIAVAVAHAIENRLILHKAWRNSEIANNYKSTIINSINEGIIAIGPEREVTIVNDVAARYIGLDKKEILGQPLTEVIKVHDQEFTEIIHGKKYPTDREMTFHSAKGVVRCMITARPVAGSAKETVIIFSEVRRAREIARRMAGARAQVCFEDLIGNDSVFLSAIKLAKTIAPSNSNVLLLGESGVGKDVFAQAIHNASTRRKGPFVALNCASIPRDLLGSELFGYEEGAFTGARRGGNPGKFELADGGTIFLDEIGEMSSELQVMLLRVLEERKIVRLSGKEVIPIDVRVIAATNKDLLAACHQGSFRFDLYYRLNVVSLRVPSLRERPTDLDLLTVHFMNKFSQQLGKAVREVDPRVLERFRNYSWPGNVRELQNVVERAVNLAQEPVLTIDLLPEGLPNGVVTFPGRISEEQEKDAIKRLLKTHRGNITRVAREMGVARSTIYRKIYKYRLHA